MPLRVYWVWRAQLGAPGASMYMGLDETYGEKIATMCAAMGWREQEWEFVWSPIDTRVNGMPAVRVDRERTPRSYGLDEDKWLCIVCMPAEADN